MTSNRLAIHFGARAAVIAAALAASAAMAQSNTAPMPPAASPPMAADGAPAVAPGTTAADVKADPGLPGPASVDPAPGATGAYAGHSEHAFYDVDDRISRYEQRVAGLTGAQKRSATKELASIKAEEKAQIARHGSLLDWARENLNHRLDQLKATYPALAAS